MTTKRRLVPWKEPLKLMYDSPLLQRVITLIEGLYELIAANPQAQRYFGAFPRDIEGLIVYGLEIPVLRQPDLTTHAAHHYLCALSANKSGADSSIKDRELYGLLHVGPPCNLILVRKDLPEHIQNYILAHELGHFLTDVFLIRQLWLKTLPEQKEAIERAFTWQDYDVWLELHALLKGLPARPETIIGRDAMTPKVAQETAEREIYSDLFARELLAPWDVVSPLFQSQLLVSSTSDSYVSDAQSRNEFAHILRSQFGVPLRVGSHYYGDLKQFFIPGPDLTERLFAPLLLQSNKNFSKM